VLIANSNFLVPNDTFVVELVIFLLVLWFLAKYVLPPINRAMEARQQTIERSISEAEETKRRAHELEQQRLREIDEARQQARTLRDDAVKLGDQLRQELQRKGEEEYQRLVTRAGADIEASARKAADTLRAQVAALVMDVVEKVLEEGISVQDQQRLVDDAISEVEARAASSRTGPLSAVAGFQSGPGRAGG